MKTMEQEIGKVTHYYSHLNVAVLELTNSLKVGDLIHVQGHSTDFMQTVTSMEINHHMVTWVKPGDNVALKVIEPAHPHDVIFRITEEVYQP
jgi:putative protease